MSETGDSDYIPWHSAFYQAIQAELDEYRDSLEFIPEYELNSAPQQIDIMIIKKITEMEIKKSFAKIFASDNVFEYKSPDVTLTIYDYYKTQGYARQYASINRKFLSDMSVTLVVMHKPRELFKKLSDDFVVREFAKGIYYVDGEVCPTQVVVSREISEDENFWLYNLRKELKRDIMKRVIEEILAHKLSASLDAYGFVVTEANYQTLKELQEMMNSKVAKFVEEIGLAKRLRAEGKIEGKAEGKAEDVLSVLRFRYESVPDDIKNAVMSYSDEVALASLFQCALTCGSLEEFEKSLVH